MSDIKFCKTFHFLSASLEKTMNNNLKKKDLSFSQGIVLLWLSKEDSLSLPIKIIEKRFRKAQPTTLGIIQRLEQKQLISTYLSDHHKKIVTITKEGLLLIDFIEENIKQADALIFQDFSKEQQLMFLELLGKAELNLLNYYGMDRGDYDEE
ncbi:MarR family winged helix-turn-helix transcriptional regulator [Tannockella kyphosi]|uniref:MarR family winged helix-turn-helix transcriptional regulator n=1 Tax=Tannockella kyphosi TaxID=2899121 RepID=UPI002012A398|nr:hypothetical protein [Tannockella kyphosi]